MRNKGSKRFYNPEYLRQFTYKQEPSIKGAKYDAVKSGQYNLEEEEFAFDKLLRELESKPKRAEKLLQNVGLLKYDPKLP